MLNECLITVVGLILLHLPPAVGLIYDPTQVGFNLNENQTATNPLDYWGEWPDHTFFPSPQNWRMPMYTLFLDRFVNGDPSNDDANGTQFEHDILSTQMRYGGDLQGLQDTLDYLQGMGIRTLYLAGSPMLNMPWGSDGYSPLDLTLLDRHFGDISKWREAIAEVHRRGMYIILDNTFATLGDLMAFEGYLNASTPFAPKEHNVVWKSDRRYHDFEQSDTYLDKCDYPRFWGDDGKQVTNLGNYLVGCRDSDFDQYGEIASFGDYTEWQRQLSKFAFVQDRLREWRPSVLAKIQHFSCMMIASLDIDGFRIDKALQVTIDSQASWSASIRTCAARYNKTNFFIPGEIVSGNAFGAIYIGRGMEPGMQVDNLTHAVAVSDNGTDRDYIRDIEHSALDAAAFHYTVYRALTRFLGMDGTYEAEGDPPVNFVSTWNALVHTNDMANAYTGEFDPRHMYGVENQDVFRWPSIVNGTEKNLLGLFIVTLLFPGIPTISWGEEQAFYVLDNTASNYVFGRSPMASSQAWEMHGCYKVGSIKYNNFPVEAARFGCEDDNISLDHRDPSHPVRNAMKAMFEMRENFPVLNDGWYLEQLSNHTYDIYLPGSNHTPTETGLWSVYRSVFEGAQTVSDAGQGNQSVWLLYTNENRTVEYTFDCASNDSLLSPFIAGTTVRNLFPPYEEYTLSPSSKVLGLNGIEKPNGCIANFSMPPWGFKALVPMENFVVPKPVITYFKPGHDLRLFSDIDDGQSVHLEIGFSAEMDCDSISNSITVTSTTEATAQAFIDNGSVKCSAHNITSTDLVGVPTTFFRFEADLVDVHHGIHRISLNNVTSSNGRSTDSVDHFLLRLGSFQNPMVYPKAANYSTALLRRDDEGNLIVSHRAAGADRWRYSLNFATTYSDWLPYVGGNSTLTPQPWTGTSKQAWHGDHVIVQYWSSLAGSSDHFQHGEQDPQAIPRRVPNLFLEGEFNQYGYDAGLHNQFSLRDNGTWTIDFMDEWPTSVSLNQWGMVGNSNNSINNGQLDVTRIWGDVDGDNILDRIPPQSLMVNAINITHPPTSKHVGYRIEVNDGSLRYELIPVGSQWVQLAMYLLLGIVPLLTAFIATTLFVGGFYGVKFNQFGPNSKASVLGRFHLLDDENGGENKIFSLVQKKSRQVLSHLRIVKTSTQALSRSISQRTTNSARGVGGVGLGVDGPRRRVIIGTMEYDIEDWSIKVKIGGLGVMAQLMGKHLSHHDLVWVIPCVGDIEYPEPSEEPYEPITATILGIGYTIRTQVHQYRNIKYILLDAPVFRQRSKAEPYPARMDDMESAIYYSAWNQSIAEVIRREKPDLYHVNDYHGAVAALYLLPQTLPCSVSLHNAEFQGLWPMRTSQEKSEVCNIFNLDPEVVERYVQFGDVFNLLHAAASYLRIHQSGFGAVGVSKKYGKRSYARYPIFWGMKDIGALPNPDPSDTAAWSQLRRQLSRAQVNPDFEASRAQLRMDAQKWANLNVDPNAELFCFVGRWSMQKGIDLIADIFPWVLEKYPNTQLLCVGPVIDLHGRFAAAKLAKMMEAYPGRVYSRPEFTQLPPYIFSGAEFALIPSRDEPFGLVAVEFGRKGALGVGARVGGLGLSPGWWYNIESSSVKHLLHQFKGAISEALACPEPMRAQLRATSAKQRFPVQQWVEDLEKLHVTSIKKHEKGAKRNSGGPNSWRSRTTVWWNNASTMVSRNSDPLEAQPSTPEPESPGLQEPTGTQLIVSNVHDSQYSRVRNAPDTPRLSDDPPGTPRSSSQAADDTPAETPGAITPGTYPWAERSARSSMDLSRPVLPWMSGNGQEGRFLQPEWCQCEHLDLAGTLNMDMADDAITPAGCQYHTSTGDQPIGHMPIPSGVATPARSVLSMDAVVGLKKDFHLQKVDASFTDAKHEYQRLFEQKLDSLNAKTSFNTIIEEFIEKSTKDWYNRYLAAKLGKLAESAKVNANVNEKSQSNAPNAEGSRTNSTAVSLRTSRDFDKEEFLLAEGYKPPRGLRRFFLRRCGDWPFYSILLAFGQIIAANSYQITLLTGEVGEAATKLYIIASIYFAATIMWWTMYRSLKSIWVLSVPFAFYAIAFLFIGVAPLLNGGNAKKWTQDTAAGCYAAASASGSVFFALNFGDQAGAPVQSWAFRACVIQGIQQLYIAALWYWGAALVRAQTAGIVTTSLIVTKPAVVTSVALTLCVLMCTIGTCLFLGLPTYYRQNPGAVPSFVRAIFRRKIVYWFLITVVIQNFFLSAPYGRTWLYLWSSKHLPAWYVVILVIGIFGLVWAAGLWVLGNFSKSHSWLFPIFAIGLGAPRWAQMLWATSGMGAYLPWAGGPIVSALVGRVLWLWLGLLDSLQGVGYGMILLNTLTRFHIVFVLLAAQLVGSLATICGRAFAPDNIGPGPGFPNLALSLNGLGNAWFWVTLLCQLVLNLVAFKFYRKEQLNKP